MAAGKPSRQELLSRLAVLETLVAEREQLLVDLEVHRESARTDAGRGETGVPSGRVN